MQGGVSLSAKTTTAAWHWLKHRREMKVVKHTLFENLHKHLHRLHQPARVKQHALDTDLHGSKRCYYKKSEVAWSDTMSTTLLPLKMFLLSQALITQECWQRCSCAAWFMINSVASFGARSSHKLVHWSWPSDAEVRLLDALVVERQYT